MNKITPITPKFTALDLPSIATRTGNIVLIIPKTGTLDFAARRVNRLCRGALARFVDSTDFTDMENGDCYPLTFPANLSASQIIIVKLENNANAKTLRRAGAEIAKFGKTDDFHIYAKKSCQGAELVFGLCLRLYDFNIYKTPKDAKKPNCFGAVAYYSEGSPAQKTAYTALAPLAEGVFFTRNLVNEPANILGTEEFAKRLLELEKIGVKVEVLEEKALEKLGMRSLLAVGQGSPSPSKVVIMQWQGGAKKAPPFALVGKGVVFDTGGISIKPANGMEEMTMDMGGAGVVAGVMKTLALRKARANVVGLVGLVENMPDGLAYRPGDIVRSMKGDTIEVINTDAEGRMVLADVLWYAQKTFAPSGMIDLATLTGAILVGLGHDYAGAFANDDALCDAFLRAAGAESEGAWRLPMGACYDKMINSHIADMKNVGRRVAGSITAAQFLMRFVEKDMPWIHLDIAGVARTDYATDFAPKGATGWGVLALNRLIADGYEK